MINESIRENMKYFSVEDIEGLNAMHLYNLMVRLHQEVGDEGLRCMPVSLCLPEVETHTSRIVCVNNECDMSTLWFKVSEELTEEITPI